MTMKPEDWTFIGLMLCVVTLSILVGCGVLNKSPVVGDLKACAAGAIQQEVINVLPAVTAIIDSGAPNWQQQLAALEAVGASAVVCAVSSVLADLVRRAPSKRELDPPLFAKIERAQIYLASKGIKP